MGGTLNWYLLPTYSKASPKERTVGSTVKVRLAVFLLCGVTFVGGYLTGTRNRSATARPYERESAVYISVPANGTGDRKRHLLTIENAARGGGTWKYPVNTGDLVLRDDQWFVEIEGNRYLLVSSFGNK
jgi:hypothetical protein